MSEIELCFLKRLWRKDFEEWDKKKRFQNIYIFTIKNINDRLSIERSTQKFVANETYRKVENKFYNCTYNVN